MKLTIVLIIAFLQVSLAGNAQKVTLSEKNVSLEQVLKQIRNQTGFNILCDAEILKVAKPVDILVNEAPIEEALKQSLAGQSLTFTIKKNTVVIQRGIMTVFQSPAMTAPAIIPIRGKVTDTKGLPVPGVSVKLKGSQVGTSTDVNGNYLINLPDGTGGVLVFSFIGYKSQEVAVASRSTINITLEEEVSTLNEVVVTGYISEARKDLTGAIGTVSVEDMQKAPVRSFEEALAGRVAGVQVTSQDGKPGSGINILIRGLGSITQDSSPLFVIDGFPLDDPNNNVIDPNTIESITVLKDASATAIYGARGSNGVIVITTKRGQKGVPRINYAGSYGVNSAPKYIKLLNPFQYVQLQSMANFTSTTSVAMKDAAAPWFRDGRILEDYRNAPGVDWQDAVLRNAPQHMHSLSLSGGSDKTLFSISGNLSKQQGIVIASDYSRYQAKATLDQTINKQAKVGLSATYTNLNQTGAPTTGNQNSALFWSAYALRPAEVAGLETNFEDLLYDPELPVTDYRINPIFSAANTVNNNVQNHFNGSLFAEYKLTKDLKFKTEGALNYRMVRLENFYGSKTYSGGPNSTLHVNGALGNYQYTQSLLRNSLNYTKTFNKAHRLTVYGAFEVQALDSKSLRLAGYDLPNEELGISGIDAGVLSAFPSTSSATSSSSIVSGLTQATYNYKSRYYLTGSLRADGSSRFRAENRWGYFPSGSVKWKLSEESFLKNNKILTDANIRASYGSTGNNNVGDYASYSQITYQNPLTINNILQPNSAVVTTIDNPDLTWEKASQFDTGIDVGFLRNKLNFTVDYYKKTISDLLFNATLPGSTGYATTTKNIGKISNRGLEFTLSTRLIETPKFSWNSNFNITFNQNRLEALSADDEEAFTKDITWEPNFNGVVAYIAKVGEPLGQIYGLISEGLYQVSDFDRTATGGYVLKPHISGIAGQQPGDPKYRDLDHNGVINDFDKAVIGRGYPIHQGGFNNNFKYKAFDLNVFLQWSYGSEVINANRIWFESGYELAVRPGYNQFASSVDRWSLENQDATQPRIGAGYFKGYSSDFVEDGSFIRLKTVNLGYTFPKNLLSKAKISSFRVYVAGGNLYTLTKYKGYDPEVSTYATGLTPGMDWSAYPRPLTITGGVSLQF